MRKVKVSVFSNLHCKLIYPGTIPCFSEQEFIKALRIYKVYEDHKIVIQNIQRKAG